MPYQPQPYEQPQPNPTPTPQYGQPQPGPAPQPQPGFPQGNANVASQPAVIQLTVQGSMLSSSIVPPSATLNGFPRTLNYGLNTIPVPAGPLHLGISMQWLVTFGKAEINLNPEPGQQIRLWYAPPFHQFAAGALGFEPQKRRGLGITLGILGVILGLPTLIILLAMIFG